MCFEGAPNQILYTHTAKVIQFDTAFIVEFGNSGLIETFFEPIASMGLMYFEIIDFD